ncbi:MAG: cupin domain-containing protein [Candidatus Latescibacterota bacterium]
MTMAVEQTQVGEQVRRLREAQGISVRTLAARSGFSASFISQVENGQASPSIASLERIALCLGVTLAGFFTRQAREPRTVIRTGQRQELSSSWSHARIEALGPAREGTRLEAVMITIEAGGGSGKRPASHHGEEFALVFDGEVTLTLGEDTHVLRRGDTVGFPSETPHLWENPGPEPVQIVIVSPRFTH